MSEIRLTDIEKNMLSRIVAYGEQHGFSAEDIRIAGKAAYIESTLGSDMETPKPTLENHSPTAKGLYQYTDPTWHDRHAQLGDKNVADNQIKAFFDDLARDKTTYQALRSDVKEKVRFDEYVYIGHKQGEYFVKRHDLDDVLKCSAMHIWDSDKKANSFDPAWIDEVHSHNHPSAELPGLELAQNGPEAILALIESGTAGGLSMQIIAAQLADLSFPQESTTQTLDRQTLGDAWNHLLENVGEDQLAQIDTVSQDGNRIKVEFEGGSIATLTCLSSGAEVDQFDAGGDLLSNNWWNADGSNGNYTYDADGSFTNTSYAADGSYSTYENDGYDAIVMNNYAADGSYSSYENDGQGSIVINDYATDGSFSSYTDDGAGNSDLNSYSMDGTPLDDGAVFADDDSGYATDDTSNWDTDANDTADDNSGSNT